MPHFPLRPGGGWVLNLIGHIPLCHTYRYIRGDVHFHFATLIGICPIRFRTHPPHLNGKCGILKYHHNHFKFPFSNLLQSSTLTPTRLTIIHLHVMFPKVFCGSRLFPRFNFLRNTKRQNKTFFL